MMILLLVLALNHPVDALESLKRDRYCRDLAELAFESLMDYRRNPGIIINAQDPIDQMVIDLAKDWKGTAIELKAKVMAECSMQTI